MSKVNNGLAWSQEQGEKKRLRSIVSVVLPIFFMVSIYVTWTDLPEQKREDLERLPPQLAKVMLKKKEAPKPVIKKKEEPKPEPEKPKVAEKPKPKVEKKPKPEIAKRPKTKPKIKAKPKEVAKAREKAKKSGVLAMTSQLSKLSAIAESVKLDTPKSLTAKPIARKNTDKLASRVAAASTRSAGVDESQFNNETQEISLATREVAQVESVEEVAADIAYEEQLAEQALAIRTTEDVRRTMDANKSAIYSIYNRALRKKPSLQGLVTPELVIESNGFVSSCAVVESTLNEPRLESKICNRLRLVNFGDKPGVDTTTIRYPIELLPS